MDALGKSNKEPIRSALPKRKEKSMSRMMITVGIGVMIFFGSGLFWVVLSSIDCSDPQINKINCDNFKSIDPYLPVGIVIGIMIIGLGTIIFYPSNEQQNSTEVIR